MLGYLNFVAFLTTVFFVSFSISFQIPLHKHGIRNVTLNFDDLPTHDGFGKITSYHNLDFSSFTLVNTSSAASAGHISSNDSYCATSSHNALIAHKAKTPSLWPRIALDPLAHTLPGEAPFFSLHGMSMKPMNVTNSVVCIFISAYGIDDHKFVRALDSMFACFSPQRLGGYVNITRIFPGWGKATNMIEMYAEAIIGDGEDQEWVDWPFCIDDLTVEVLDGESEWSEPWWRIAPLLPPPAPFQFDDQLAEARRTSAKHSPFSKEGGMGFQHWIANGANSTLLGIEYMTGTY